MPKTAQLQEDCDKYYARALENLAACGYQKVDFDHLGKEEEHFWKKVFPERAVSDSEPAGGR